jgi:bifunctional non-homologous end joining protein LigD
MTPGKAGWEPAWVGEYRVARRPSGGSTPKPAKPRAKPRVARRKLDSAPDQGVTSAPVVRRADPRQAGLFDERPEWVRPCCPILVERPPGGPSWLHEIKHDGYRVCAVVDAGTARLLTRRGHDWSDRMPNIAAALAALKVRSAVIDGEAVMTGEDGLTDFFTLHAALARGFAPQAALVAFDILHLDGEDMRGRTLEDRHGVLFDVLPPAFRRRLSAGWLQLSEAIAGEGEAVYRGARALGLEGIVSKRLGSPYVSGPFDGWRKTKCTTTEDFAVTGIEAEGSHRERRSVTLSRLVGDMQLAPCGSAGAGLSDADLREIRAALRSRAPIVAVVEHRGLTPDGQLRHPAVRSWRRC